MYYGFRTLCPHYIYSSTEVHSSYRASIGTGHAGGPWVFDTNSALETAPVCDFGLGATAGGTTLNAPRAYLRNSRYGCKEYYFRYGCKVSSYTRENYCACYTRRLSKSFEEQENSCKESLLTIVDTWSFSGLGFHSGC